MAEALGIAKDAGDKQNLVDHGVWGGTVPGVRINLGEPLFPRIDIKKKVDQPAAHATVEKKTSQEKKVTMADPGLVVFDDFKKLDLRVAEITAAEKIDKSDRLLKLTVKAPEERTVVAGIAEYYTPEELIGLQVIMVANLKPAKLMGVTSHGMILAARNGQGRLTLSTLAERTEPGSKVS